MSAPASFAPWEPRHGRPEQPDDQCDGCGMPQAEIDRSGACACDREFDNSRDREMER